MKISQVAFTLIELIVVISIMVLLTTSSVFYFFDFSDRRELIVHMDILKDRIHDLDRQVKDFKISDYQLTFTGGYDYALGNKNTLGVTYPLTLSIADDLQATLGVDGGSLDQAWKYSIFSQGKEIITQVTSAETQQNYMLTAGQEYEIYGYVDGAPTNTFFIYNIASLERGIELSEESNGVLYNRNNIISSQPNPLSLVFSKSGKQDTLILQ